MRVDLHCHSTCSDGTAAAAAVGARARERGIELFSLTDHDTCAGHSVVAAAFGPAIRGVELSCDDGAGTVHILVFDSGLGPFDELERRLSQIAERRRERLRIIGANLARRGVHLDVESILAAAGTKAVGRPDLARALVEGGFATSVKDAFMRYLYDGGPGDPGGHRLPLQEGLALGRAVGARMSLAHPHLIANRAARLLHRYRTEGLDAIEAFYGTYAPGERHVWTRLAEELDLVCTAGSDRHTEDDTDLGIDLPDTYGKRLRDWLGR